MDKIFKFIDKRLFLGASESGMALPDTLIALFIVGSALTGTVYKMSDMSDVQKYQESLTGFSDVAASISASAVNLATLQKSVHNNPNAKLKNCLTVDGSKNCTETNTVDYFVLEDNRHQVAGTKSKPKYMNFNGSECSTKDEITSKKCAYEVVSSYRPVCGLLKTGGKSCDVAQSILITVEINPITKIGSKDAYWSDKARTPKPLSFTREVAVSVGDLMKDLASGTIQCGIDSSLMASLQKRKQGQNGYSSISDPNWNGTTQYRKYLRGITWNGSPICHETGIRAEQPTVGKKGPNGPSGSDGPRGPQGPPGNC